MKVINKKVVGIIGDGALAKGNAPFRKEMFKLLGKTVVIRWDPHHLINRAHIEARGKLGGVGELDDDDDFYENEEEGADESNEEDDDGDESMDQADCFVQNGLLKELINYIKKYSKKKIQKWIGVFYVL